jgi:outer membrane protein assembly factor BamD
MLPKVYASLSGKSAGFLPRLMAGVAITVVAAGCSALYAQEVPAAQPTAQGTPATTPDPAQGQAADQATAPAQAATSAQSAAPVANATYSNVKPKKKKVAKADRVQQTKDTKVAVKKEKKLDPLAGKDAQLPDKQLYDKAMAQTKSGHYDIARLDLQTLLNTYPDSQYMMRSKLAVADAWYKEGGSAALTQAEQEYKDFITFFPNVPESAEAQLRVGDIYFKQMDVPDRDYSKGMHAQEEYRTMLKQYPDAPKKLTDEARQKLREVQEVMAEREAELGAFYASHANWAAAIARYQTVIDTYPLYSHMDDVMIGAGDAYEAEAAIVRAQKLPEAVRVKLLEEDDGKAAAYYRKVVMEHSAAPHVEDAKERLATMNLPVPTPTAEQAAASEELEGSRAQYNMQNRLAIFFMHKPDTVTTAQTGMPPLEDPPPTVAPAITRSLVADYKAAFNPNAAVEHAPVAPVTDGAATAPADTAAAAVPVTGTPTLSDVPGSGEGAGDESTTTMTSAPAATPRTGNSVGMEIITPGANGSATVGTPASTLPAATGAPDPNYGLPAPAGKLAALPPIEKPADAPDQVNDVQGKPEPAAQVRDPKSKKKPKTPALDKADESSSKKKPKKGVDKLNPC